MSAHERSEAEFHRTEAERFRRLSGLARDPRLKRNLADIAFAHARIADELRALERPPGPAPPAPRQDSYQIRLVGGRDPLVQPIDAESDIVALRICYLLHDACSEVYRDFELWRGSRVIARSADRRGASRPDELPMLTAEMQDSALKTEEMLLESRHAIASSRKLLLATRRLREEIAHRRAGGRQG
jgi:hypothetical protein